MAEQDPDQTRLVYFADPMCSWCWGFAPVIRAVVDRHGETAPMQLVMGGLRAGNTAAMEDKDKAYIRDHWTHVQERTGQPFDFAFFERVGFVYDTEPACRAVVTARSFDTDHGLGMMERVQEAFYAKGQDTTDRDTLVSLAGHEGLDETAYGARFDSRDAEMLTKIDFEIASQTGVAGFPTLLVGTGRSGFTVITRGYLPLDSVEANLDAWAAEA